MANMMRPILYIFSGLPATGKSTLAQNLAQTIGAVYIRVDTIEQGLRDLCGVNVQGEGYRLAYRITSDNLKIGNSVVADQCNPIELTRKEWNDVAIRNDCDFVNIEIVCSDADEHKKRSENRVSDIETLKLPTWKEIVERDYEPWSVDHITIDTANRSIDECVKELLEKVKR